MQIQDTPLAGVTLLTPARYGDARGFFSESWNRRRMAEAGLDYDFVQDNHSLSEQAGTIRGLHFQAPPTPRPNWCAAGADGCWMSLSTSAKAARPMANGWPKS